MSYTIVENPGGVITLSTSGPGHAFRVLGTSSVHGHRVTQPPEGATITATNGAAGSAAVAPLLTGNDTAGYIVQGSSANPVVGAETVITFGSPYGIPPYLSLLEANPSTSAISLYAVASTNSFTVFAGAAPAASGTLAFYYMVLG